MKFNTGFTLVELMVTVAVVGILAVVAIPSYQAFLSNSKIDSCIKYVIPLKMSADYLIEQGDPVTLASLGADNSGGGNCSGGLQVNFVNEVDTDGDGSIDESDVSLVAISEGNTMTLTRDRSNGVWSCSSSDSSLAPTIC